MSPEDSRHGTAAGASAHKRAGIPICAPCRLAHNAQKRTWKRLPQTPCLTCQQPTTAEDRVCRACRHREAIAARPVPETYALTGGEWVPSDGIMRWLPTSTHEAPVIPRSGVSFPLSSENRNPEMARSGAGTPAGPYPNASLNVTEERPG